MGLIYARNLILGEREYTVSVFVIILLPPTNEVWGKVIFSEASVSLSTGVGSLIELVDGERER